jgi:aminodeoxyfutalosine deaminase
MSDPATTILTAAYLAPMDRPLLRTGAVAMSGGKIVRIGDAVQVCRSHRAAEVIDLGESIILPGLVNAHVHLELSGLDAGAGPGGRFIDWIGSLRRRIRRNGDRLAEVVSVAVGIGLEQCRRFGVTSVGDISQHMQITRSVLKYASIRCTSFGEVLGLANLKWRYEELLPQAVDPGHASATLRIGLTPHAPYTVDLHGYRQCLQLAHDLDLPLATHLAETPDERLFLEHHAGPFREIWDSLGQWVEPVPTFAGGPIEFAQSIGLLDHPTLLAHVNYCDDRELERLARGRASVVYCPRTHAYFGHPPHRWRGMLERGINVAVGTDSCASSPDLNLVDDLRLLRRIAPEFPAQSLWELATLRAARALRMEEQVGSLTVGKCADVTVFPVFPSDAPDPLEAILRDPQRLPSCTWFNGALQVAAGGSCRP